MSGIFNYFGKAKPETIERIEFSSPASPRIKLVRNLRTDTHLTIVI